MLARKAVRREVKGDGEGEGDLCVGGVLRDLHKRQLKWHERYASDHENPMAAAMQRERRVGKECVCVQAVHIENLRRAVDAVDL